MFQNLQDLIDIQNLLRNSNNLINTRKSDSSNQFNQHHNSVNLINTMDNEIFLINEELHIPLLHIANKLLGRQNLNFDQLTSPEQQLWNLF